MHFDEALHVLGITPDVTADGARRAYLRLTKLHKPDRDPEGFRRIREAYEVASQQLAWHAQVPAVTRAAHVEAPPADSAPANSPPESATANAPADAHAPSEWSSVAVDRLLEASGTPEFEAVLADALETCLMVLRRGPPSTRFATK